jgi:hypothetical protein
LPCHTTLRDPTPTRKSVVKPLALLPLSCSSHHSSHRSFIVHIAHSSLTTVYITAMASHDTDGDQYETSSKEGDKEGDKEEVLEQEQKDGNERRRGERWERRRGD